MGIRGRLRCSPPLVGLGLAQLLAPVHAQGEAKPATTPDVQFSQQLDELKKSFTDVGRQIDESAKSIDTIKSPEEGRKSIEDLRGQVAKLLDAVADNGEISKLGAKALALAEEKLKTLDRETRFKPEEKQYLVNRWRELRSRHRSRHPGSRRRAQGFRRAVALAADQRGLHRRADADPRAREGAAGDPSAERRHPRSLGEAEEAARLDQAAGRLMRLRAGLVALTLLALAGCNQGGTGYVELKTVPANARLPRSISMPTRSTRSRA